MPFAHARKTRSAKSCRTKHDSTRQNAPNQHQVFGRRSRCESPIRRHHSQRETLVGLGLNRIGRVNWVPDTPATRGMIDKVSHLVRINHDPAAPKPPRPAQVDDEADDRALLHELAFDLNSIMPELYSDEELKRGKAPDFKLFVGDSLRGFCEKKSPKEISFLRRPRKAKLPCGAICPITGSLVVTYGTRPNNSRPSIRITSSRMSWPLLHTVPKLSGAISWPRLLDPQRPPAVYVVAKNATAGAGCRASHQSFPLDRCTETDVPASEHERRISSGGRA